ncbi:MAG: 1-deoxy-D-xylulose-5-phosphate reductoisomerase [Coriobacteriales bacterium]|jgi:1-deoxy-D-xylulose-5-phosphate reductoisomerase
MTRLRIALLGSTGSIGTQTLDVCRMHPDRIEVVALACGRRVDELVSQAREFGVKHLALGDSSTKDAPALNALGNDVTVGFGPDAVEELTQLEGVDVVLNALSGAAGLRASYATLKSGRTLALANKESLVVGGELLMPLATHETLIPVDSEHSAIYQCYLGEHANEARRIWLTCSGGPFRGMTRAELERVTPEQALSHPTWNMGPKITIDSATLMNKGLEVIEAKHLFSMGVDDIRVVVHPQSCVHSMVEYVDGSVKAHLGVADMRIPIQFALSYPHRWESPAEQIDFTKIHPLEFFDPDYETFRCLKLALEAGRQGGTAPCVMNAANEVAVAAFLAEQCTLTDIDACVEDVLAGLGCEPVESLEQLEHIDDAARARAHAWLER